MHGLHDLLSTYLSQALGAEHTSGQKQTRAKHLWEGGLPGQRAHKQGKVTAEKGAGLAEGRGLRGEGCDLVRRSGEASGGGVERGGRAAGPRAA